MKGKSRVLSREMQGEVEIWAQVQIKFTLQLS